MRNVGKKFSAVMFFVLLVFLCSMGAKPADLNYKEGEKVKITGQMRLVGNEPFTRIVIRDRNDVNIFLPADLDKEYRKMSLSAVEAEGIFYIETVYSADHKYKIRENHLSNVVLMKKIEPPQE